MQGGASDIAIDDLRRRPDFIGRPSSSIERDRGLRSPPAEAVLLALVCSVEPIAEQASWTDFEPAVRLRENDYDP